MAQWWNRLKREERGTQLLEFILTFPLVWALLVFSFDQFTILYNRQQALAAAYEAGRIAAVQPTYSLARFHGKLQGEKTLEQAMSATGGEVRVILEGKWKKGNHVQTEASVSFRLLASGAPVEVTETYHMMIENAEETE